MVLPYRFDDSNYQEILQSADFQTGKFDTSFVDTHPELIQYSVHRTSRDLAIAIGAAVAAHTGL